VSAPHGSSQRNGRMQAGSAWLPGSLLWRVAVLSIVVVFVQIGVVSELPVLGVSIDLSPLLVAFTGLLCGSTLGAVAGFGVGLLVDLALMQTLGVTSLTFTIVGYWSGRLRELRDPQAALTPLLVGTAAAAAAMVGYSLIEFLLGVDAPVSLELVRQIVIGDAEDDRRARCARSAGHAGRDRREVRVGDVVDDERQSRGTAARDRLSGGVWRIPQLGGRSHHPFAEIGVDRTVLAAVDGAGCGRQRDTCRLGHVAECHHRGDCTVRWQIA